MMLSLLLIPLCAILNRLRGDDWGGAFTSKGAIAAYIGIAYGLLAWSWLAGLAVFAGFWLWALPGWGKYFAAFHGNYNAAEREFWPADELADRVYGRTGNAYTAGAAGMAVRGLLLVPLFIALAVAQGPWFVGLMGLGGALMGPCYSAGRLWPAQAVHLCEVLFGAVIGGLLALSVFL